MTFKLASADQFCQDILFKSGDGAAVKTHTQLKNRKQGTGNDHIADTEGRGNRAGKGVEVDNILAGGTGKKSFLRFAEEREL